MVRVYGTSNSENSFLSLINSNLKVINVESLEEYNHFKTNYKEERKQLENEYTEKIDSIIKEITLIFNMIKQNNYDIGKKQRLLNYKESVINRYWGRVYNEIKNEIYSLKKQIKQLNEDNAELKLEVVENQTKRDLLKNEKDETLSQFDKDIILLYQLENDSQFRNYRAGAVGENKLIDYISSNYKKEDTFNLFNDFKLDIRGCGININNSTKTETQIDHLLVCPKGLYFIETKFWRYDCTKDFEDKLLEQLEKIKLTIPYLFKSKNFVHYAKILLIGTEKKIEINNPDIISVKLTDLNQYLKKQEDVLTKSDIILILNELSKFILKEKHQGFPYKKIRINSWFIKLRNKVKRIKTKR